MQFGIFQLLSRPQDRSDREVIEQALWEVDFAEAHGFDRIWFTEHHLSDYGLIGPPSVYGAAVAQRTRRIGLGYAVAVVPLHHPLRLAEELAWVDQLSDGRLWVGIGPGFSGFEFSAFGVPLTERHARMEEALRVIVGAMSHDPYEHHGHFWDFGPVQLRPRPYTAPHPPFLLATSSERALIRAAELGLPPMLAYAPPSRVEASIARYAEVRRELGIEPWRLAEELRHLGVLLRVVVADSDEVARTALHEGMTWYVNSAVQTHFASRDPSERGTAATPPLGTLPDGRPITSLEDLVAQHEATALAGTPATVLNGLREYAAVGTGHILAWMNLGSMDPAIVRRSMELMAREVLPGLRAVAAGGVV